LQPCFLKKREKEENKEEKKEKLKEKQKERRGERREKRDGINFLLDYELVHYLYDEVML
jgi:hypothetical protein